MFRRNTSPIFPVVLVIFATSGLIMMHNKKADYLSIGLLMVGMIGLIIMIVQAIGHSRK